MLNPLLLVFIKINTNPSLQNSLVTPSSSSKLSLSNVSLITSGYFMCMVTGGDIPFKEDYDTKHVTVAGEDNIEQDGFNVKI